MMRTDAEAHSAHTHTHSHTSMAQTLAGSGSHVHEQPAHAHAPNVKWAAHFAHIKSALAAAPRAAAKSDAR